MILSVTKSTLNRLTHIADMNGLGLTGFCRMLLMWACRVLPTAHIRWSMLACGPHRLDIDVPLDESEVDAVCAVAREHAFGKFKLGGLLEGCIDAFSAACPSVTDLPTQPKQELTPLH